MQTLNAIYTVKKVEQKHDKKKGNYYRITLLDEERENMLVMNVSIAEVGQFHIGSSYSIQMELKLSSPLQLSLDDLGFAE